LAAWAVSGSTGRAIRRDQKRGRRDIPGALFFWLAVDLPDLVKRD
jgi:hypothetical protein